MQLAISLVMAVPDALKLRKEIRDTLTTRTLLQKARLTLVVAGKLETLPALHLLIGNKAATASLLQRQR